MKRAGLTVWPRLWHNLRASRQTELTEIFPAHVASVWLSNSERIAAQHDLQVLDSHFPKAARIPARFGAEMSELDGSQHKRPLRDNESFPAFPGDSTACSILLKR